jgi:hypothetical protein
LDRPRANLSAAMALGTTLFEIHRTELPQDARDGICVHLVYCYRYHRPLPRVGVAVPDSTAVFTKGSALDNCGRYAGHLEILDGCFGSGRRLKNSSNSLGHAPFLSAITV